MWDSFWTPPDALATVESLTAVPQTVADTCGRLRTVAVANAKLGEHSLTPRPPSETGTLATHSGKINNFIIPSWFWAKTGRFLFFVCFLSLLAPVFVWEINEDRPGDSLSNASWSSCWTRKRRVCLKFLRRKDAGNKWVYRYAIFVQRTYTIIYLYSYNFMTCSSLVPILRMRHIVTCIFYIDLCNFLSRSLQLSICRWIYACSSMVCWSIGFPLLVPDVSSGIKQENCGRNCRSCQQI